MDEKIRKQLEKAIDILYKLRNSIGETKKSRDYFKQDIYDILYFVIIELQEFL